MAARIKLLTLFLVVSILFAASPLRGQPETATLSDSEPARVLWEFDTGG